MSWKMSIPTSGFHKIFYCLRICLTRLLLFVMGGRCSNYFIPESNLFLKTRFIEKKCQIQKKLYEVLLYENAYICFTVSLVIPINAIILRNESHELRTFDSLCLALTVVNGHHATYHECIRSILRIMNALQFEKNHRRIAILKYIWLLVMRRIGIILYDTFVLTGCKSCLLSAEVALLFAQHTDVFGLIYLATLWHCQGRYKQCIKLICNATKNCTGIPLNAIIYNKSLTAKCTKTPCDYISLFEHHFVKPTVEIHRASVSYD